MSVGLGHQICLINVTNDSSMTIIYILAIVILIDEMNPMHLIAVSFEQLQCHLNLARVYVHMCVNKSCFLVTVRVILLFFLHYKIHLYVLFMLTDNLGIGIK